MSAQHTAGPWYWHTDSAGRVSLRTPDRGNLIVMDCARKGMQGATLRFAMWGDMTDGKPRGRLGGILVDAKPDVLQEHPDARLITAAPDMLDALQSAERAMSNPHFAAEVLAADSVVREMIRAAIAAATGSTA